MTAVEWLDNELWKIRLKLRGGEISIGLYSEKEVELIEKSKQMEKEHHEQTWNVAHQAGRFEGKGIAEENWQTFEQYYNETYGTQ